MVSAALYFLGKNATIEELDRCIQDMYIIPYDYSTKEESVARYAIEEWNAIEIPYEIEDYFDYEAYGRDLLIEYSYYMPSNYENIYLKGEY